MDEILFTNIDVTSAVLNTIFNSLAVDQVFQKTLRAEISKEKSKENSKVEAYIAKQDSLLNFLIMESMRLTPAFGKLSFNLLSNNLNILKLTVPPFLISIFATGMHSNSQIHWWLQHSCEYICDH